MTKTSNSIVEFGQSKTRIKSDKNGNEHLPALYSLMSNDSRRLWRLLKISLAAPVEVRNPSYGSIFVLLLNSALAMQSARHHSVGMKVRKQSV